MIQLRRLKKPSGTDSTQAHQEWKDAIGSIGSSVRDLGHLIIFPTETVYGIGANALSKKSVLKIFEAKQRPLSDPLICHVYDFQQAACLWDCSSRELQVLECLATAYWPGPLSLVALAKPHVPIEVTAGSGFVAARCPSNEVALSLLKLAEVPLAAPSANKFGRISPTSANHVFKNFENMSLQNADGQDFIYVLDDGPCAVGIESTVCKVSSSSGDLLVTLLRRGLITAERIRETLTNSLGNLAREEIEKVKVREEWEVWRGSGGIYSSSCNGVTGQKKVETVVCSPGTSLEHYAPRIPTYLLQPLANGLKQGSRVEFRDSSGRFVSSCALSSCVLIDAFLMFRELREVVSYYLQLSEDATANGIRYAQRSIFAILHDAEDYALTSDVQAILIADFMVFRTPEDESLLTVYDRVYRSASGRKAYLSQ